MVEPPHRGDRDRSLDALPLHTMVRRALHVPNERKEEFLTQLDALLRRNGV